MKKGIALLLALALCCAGMAGAAAAETYTASAQGFGGQVSVTLTIDGDKLTDVTVEGTNETEGVGSRAIDTLPAAEPIGPKKLCDLLIVAPCTGNTCAKLALGIADTPVTMAVKSALRIGIPVVLCCATNDAMAASGPNLLRLLNTKNVYLVPLRQDDPVKKPVSLVADFTLLPQAIALALEGKQLQPVFLPPHTGA